MNLVVTSVSLEGSVYSLYTRYGGHPNTDEPPSLHVGAVRAVRAGDDWSATVTLGGGKPIVPTCIRTRRMRDDDVAMPVDINLVAAIEEYLRVNNDDPKPFIWTATAEQILAKVRRGRVTLQQVTSQN